MSGRVVITGVSQGLGEALARLFLVAGWSVKGIGRNAPEWATNGGDKFAFHRADLMNESEIREACSRIREPIDILINNAGIFGLESRNLVDLSSHSVSSVFQVNVIAPILITKLLEPMIDEGQNKLVIMVSSGNGSISGNYNGDLLSYKISKAALNQATRSIANEWSGTPKTIVALAPGWARTAIGGQYAPLSADESASQTLSFALDGIYVGKNGAFVNPDGSPQPW
jgi:NAD(P)-dependent dehydrogenase (short-subunit alcohol dehydrogenase family)